MMEILNLMEMNLGRKIFSFLLRRQNPKVKKTMMMSSLNL